MTAPALVELYGRALHAAERGDLTTAVELYREIIAADPSHGPARNDLTCLLIDRGELDEAVALAADAREGIPEGERLGLATALGYARLEAGDAGRAEALFRAVLAENPERSETRNHLALALLRLDRPTEALAELLRVVRERPKCAEGWNNLGGAYWRLRDIERARDSFETALRVQPYDVDAHNNLGCVLRELRDLPSALEQFTVAVELEPDNPSIHLNLATSHHELGDHRRACSHLRRHLALTSGSPGEEALALGAILGADEGGGAETRDRSTS